MLLSCDGLSTLFGTEHTLVSQVRSWGLNTLDSLPIVKRELMKWAS
jgi:hypothetical protein